METANVPLASMASTQILHPAAPSTIDKPLPPTSGQHSSALFINKEWTLPPRPKPGRKPALDTPPTKRKAQNRDAQRAFRERRAAKVGELEQQMTQIEGENRKEQEVLKSHVKQLERDVEHCTNLVAELQQRHQEMQLACDRERHLREAAETEVNLLRRSLLDGDAVVPVPSQRLSRSDNWLDQATPTAYDVTNITCGKCTNDTRCQCVEEAFEMAGVAGDAPITKSKRPHSPSINSDSKRTRKSDQDDYTAMEIDFTAQFSSRRPATLTTSASSTSSIPAILGPDACGFCQDGTPCICAEMEKDQTRLQKAQEAIYNAAPKPQAPNSAAQLCNQNPGSCEQCQTDPKSYQFCKAVAASRSTLGLETLVSSPRRSVTVQSSSDSILPATGSTLTCASAFTTLARHPAFPQASSELGSWVPQLTAVPSASNIGGRTAFEIEAASVMGVLRTFDRRFSDRSA